MISVGVFDAKNRLTALLDEVETGAEITITRRGKPIARLIPATAGFNREAARRTADALIEASHAAKLDGISIADLIAEGRR
jgi:prevent-host-death family protein